MQEREQNLISEFSQCEIVCAHDLSLGVHRMKMEDVRANRINPFDDSDFEAYILVRNFFYLSFSIDNLCTVRRSSVRAREWHADSSFPDEHQVCVDTTRDIGSS